MRISHSWYHVGRLQPPLTGMVSAGGVYGLTLTAPYWDGECIPFGYLALQPHPVITLRNLLHAGEQPHTKPEPCQGRARSRGSATRGRIARLCASREGQPLLSLNVTIIARLCARDMWCLSGLGSVLHYWTWVITRVLSGGHAPELC